MIPIQPDDEVLKWLRGKTAAELGVIAAHEICPGCLGTKILSGRACADCDGTGRAVAPRNFFPESLRYRGPSGNVIEEPILLVIPREDDLSQATREAVAHVAKQYPKRTVETPAQARELIGEIRFELIDTFAILAICIRNVQPPHIRSYISVQNLVRRFEPTTLNDAWGRLEMLRRLWDVRVSELDEEQFWAIASEVARVKNASPLVVLAPGLHEPFTTRLACELAVYRTCKSCCGCKQHSTPE